MVKPVLIFRHDDWVGAGYFAETLERHDIRYELVALDRGDSVPSNIENIAGLAFLGGNMSVNDSYSWINDELNLIRLAKKTKLPVFGHCFGAQLISKALGGEISAMSTKEIGWHKIEFINNQTVKEWFVDLPSDVNALLWHADAMTIPTQAIPLYSTAFNAHQAFTIGNMIATIPHVEVTTEMLLKWLEEYYDDLTPLSSSVQSIEEISKDIEQRVNDMRILTNVLYDRWLDMLYAYNKNN